MTYTEHLTPKQVRELYQYYGGIPTYAWPGGYPLVYMYVILDDDDNDNDNDNETNVRIDVCVCAKCAQSAETGGNVGVELTGAFIHYEGAPITCGHCSEQIESAYGEVPDEPSGELVDGGDY